MMQEQPFTNRLIKEKSPHLLQHAHQAVDWFPWGEEAFQEAQSVGKPIFLSIGYATCHWCHVMAHECFSNVSVAEKMNEAFVCVKVDREELPEVDALYMEFAQSMMVGVVGWPLNLVLTPDLKPFYAMTYVPLGEVTASLSMENLISHVQEMWKEGVRDVIKDQAEKIIESFESQMHVRGAELPDELHIINTAELLFKIADPLYGGVKGMPKFPIVCQVCFLLRYVKSSSDGRGLFYVLRTIEMMNRGGIHDHLRGGYARYTADEKWQVPHFEKMLYDNALISRAALEIWQLTKKPEMRQMAENTLEYMLQVLKGEQGCFYCAEDSDFDDVEGGFYTWDLEEVIEILGSQDGVLFCEFYDVTKEGNFNGSNILNTPHSLEEFADIRGMDPDDLELLFKAQRRMLRESRGGAKQPFVDRKVLSSWNGLAIYAFAEAYRVLQDQKYLQAAQEAARFVKTKLWDQGTLQHSWCDGEAKFSANLDDYAYMIHGLITLFECDGEAAWLAWSMQLAATAEKLFKVEDGAFYATDGSDPNLVVQRCEFIDGAMPSGNGIHCENLLRLYQITYDERYLIAAEDTLRAVKDFLDGFNPSYCYHLIALHWYLDEGVCEIVVALNEAEEHKVDIQCALADRFIPFQTVTWRREDDEHLFELLPLIRLQKPIDGKTTVYICKEGQCLMPLNDLERILQEIKKL